MIPLNDIQYRFWMDDCLRSDNAYNVSYSFRITGTIDERLLEMALHQVMAAYKPFHSTIRRDGMQACFLPETDFKVPLQVSQSDDSSVEKVLDRFAGKRFLLESEYPCRFLLVKTPSCSYLLTLFHHIVMDGLTMVEFCGYLSSYYTALCKGEPLPACEAPTLEEFNSYWEGQPEEEKEADLSYWTDYLKGTPLHFPLPGERETATRQGSQLYAFEAGEKLCAQSLLLAKEMQTTPFRLYASAWGIVLQYFLQTDTLVLDHTIHLRPKCFQGLLGSFVNNLPIRIPFEEMELFSDVVRFMDENRTKERQHQRATYTDIILRMRQQKELAESRELFNVSIDYPIRNHSFRLDFPGCRICFHRQILAEMIGDICLVIEEKSNLPCSIRYKQGMDPHLVLTMAEAFLLVLGQAVASPQIPIRQLRFISPEREASLIESARQSLYAPLPAASWKNVVDAIRQRANQSPQKTALRFHGESLGYGELYRKAESVATFLNKKIGSGKPVGIWMHRGFEMVIAMVGILRSGNHYVPFDTGNPPARLNQIIADCQIPLVLTQGEESAIPPLDTEALPICHAYPSIAGNLPKIQEGQTAYIIYTSGTTGQPKGIGISHGNLDNLVRNDTALFRLTERSIVLHSSNICFDASVTEIFSTLSAGATMVITHEEEMKDPSLTAQLLVQEKVTCATIPPALLPLLPKREYPELETLILGGESVSAEAVSHWRGKYRIINAYGPTENTVDTSACVLTDETPVNDIGTPLAGVTCYVLDKHGRLLPDYLPGELYIGGKQLTKGYLNHPEMNSQKFVPNPFVTDQEKSEGKFLKLYKSGDWVKRLPNQHLIFLGRTDFQVKIRGLRIELEDVANNINQLEGVRRSFVDVQILHGEKQLVAYVEPEKDSDLSIPSLRKRLAESIPAYMVPNYWAILPGLPLNGSGKIDRSLLPAPALSKGGSDTVRPPRTGEEELLCRIVSSVMGISSISPDADLFDWGISSMQVMQAAFEAQEFGLDCSVSKFYESRTVAGILANHHSRFCYWASPWQEGKPVLLIVCGYPYLSPSYDTLVHYLKDDFSLLVLESYNEYFKGKEECSLDALLDFYSRLLSMQLKGKVLAGMTGLCLGGEIALQLAYRLDKQKVAHPKVFVLDGFSDRLEDKSHSFIEEPGIDEETNQMRNRISDSLIDSFFFHAYQGEVHICLANQFTRHLRFENLPEEKDPVIIRRAFERFSNNGKGWKRLLPHCFLHSINATHWSIMREEGMEKIKSILIQALYK